MDRLRAMQVFVEVTERGSLTAAADALEMSRAMASRHLESLEHWLGARLMQRSTRRLSLTAAGQEALARCRQMVELAEEMRSAAGQHTRQLRGRLRVTCSSSFAQLHLARAVGDYLNAHAQTEIELLALEHAVDLVEERVDLALRISNQLDPALVARRLTLCRSVVCASPDYLARHGEPRTAQDLALHRCLAHARYARDEWRFSRADGQQEQVRPGVRLRSNEATVLMQAALAGAGIALLPTYLVGQALASGALRHVLPALAPETLGLHAVTTSRRHQPLLLRSFVDFLAARFDPQRPYWDEALAGSA